MPFLQVRNMVIITITIIGRDTVLRWITQICIDWRTKGKVADSGLASVEKKGDTQAQQEQDQFTPVLRSDIPIRSQLIMAIMVTDTQIQEI
jgi:hypothetical protein